MLCRWWAGPWQPCSLTCGNNALKKRTVMCISVNNDEDQTELALRDTECLKETRPKEIETCYHLPVCETSSETSYISYNISVDDRGGGKFNDSALGVFNNTGIEPDILEFDNIIDLENSKNNSSHDSLSKWTVSKWSHCIDGKKTRNVTCSVVESCKLENKPTQEEACTSGKWITGMDFFKFFKQL